MDNDHLDDYTMTCLWDKSWDPSHKLPGDCDWVECLKPPTPPISTNLRVTDWDLQPIPFGDPVRFVCKRGFQFEEDPAQEEQVYTCQDGTAPDTVRGFFNVPQEEEEWPRCVRGRRFFTFVSSVFFFQDLSVRNLQKFQKMESGILNQKYLNRKLAKFAI